MRQIFKIRGEDTLVVPLTGADGYGNILYKVIKRNGVQTDERIKLHPRYVEPAAKPAPAPQPAPVAPMYGQVISSKEDCPDCGTHSRMGYTRGVACPNCDYTESFKVWLSRAT